MCARQPSCCSAETACLVLLRGSRGKALHRLQGKKQKHTKKEKQAPQGPGEDTEGGGAASRLWGLPVSEAPSALPAPPVPVPGDLTLPLLPVLHLQPDPTAAGPAPGRLTPLRPCTPAPLNVFSVNVPLSLPALPQQSSLSGVTEERKLVSTAERSRFGKRATCPAPAAARAQRAQGAQDRWGSACLRI